MYTHSDIGLFMPVIVRARARAHTHTHTHTHAHTHTHLLSNTSQTSLNTAIQQKRRNGRKHSTKSTRLSSLRPTRCYFISSLLSAYSVEFYFHCLRLLTHEIWPAYSNEAVFANSISTVRIDPIFAGYMLRKDLMQEFENRSDLAVMGQTNPSA